VDIKLTNTGDIDFSTGDLVLLDGADAIVQHLKIRFRFFLGEWFLDPRIGIPYFEQILVKNPDTNIVRSTFREVIIKTPGIANLQSLVLDYDGPTRVLSVSFIATTTDGETIDFNEEFIVGQ
jgi:hypothetical protein